MSTVLYRRLVEIRLLHEYYLINAGGANFFALSASARRTYLRTQIAYGQYNLMDDLGIEPTEKTQRLLEKHRLKFSITYTGYVIGVEVDKHVSDPGQVLSFTPRNPLPDGLVLEFILLIKNPTFRNFTNIRQSTIIPAAYLLDSADPRHTFPNLSVPVADFSDRITYETGQLAAFTTASGREVRQAQQTTQSTDHWKPVTPVEGFLNEADRRLLPKQFYVNLPGTETQRVEASLTRVTGENVMTVMKEGKERVWFDFFHPNGLTETLPDGDYNLTIKTEHGVLIKQTVYLSNAYNSTAFALIRLHHRADLGKFALLRNGALVVDPLTAEDAHLIFEICIQSRLAYWRYTSKINETLALTAPLNTLLTISPNPLDQEYVETKEPYPLRFKQTQLPNSTLLLPNPQPTVIRETGPPQRHTYVDTPIYKIGPSVIEQ